MSGRAQAQDIDYFSLPPETLLSIEITSASKRSERLSEAAAAISVITSTDIIKSGVTTIPDALRMVPGVEVAQADSNSWAISIRGFNNVLANKLLVLIDGRTVYSSLFGGTFWEAHDLLLEDIERIEVIRGPGGALWGANAVNGVINIITKHSRDTQGNLATALYGNEERGQVSYRHGGEFQDGSYRVYAKGFKKDPSTSVTGGDANDQWKGYRSGFRADWNENFTLQGDVAQTEADQLRADFSLTPPYAPVRPQTIDYTTANLLARWNKTLDNDGLISIQSYLDYVRRDEPLNFVDRRITYDLESQYSLPTMGRHEWIVGGGYRFIAGIETPGDNTTFTPNNRQDHLFNAFFQDRIAVVADELFVTLGAKFEHNAYTGFEVQPNARIQWLPDHHQTFWGSVSRAVRTPTPLEVDVDSTLGTGPGVRAALIGNENFGVEKLTAYELGYRNQITPEVSIDLATFLNDYDQLATLDLLPLSAVNNGIDPPHLLVPVIFRNVMSATGYGYEFAGKWKVSDSFNLSLNYSFLRLMLDSGDNSVFDQDAAEDNYPAHQVGLRTEWNINPEWSLNTATYFVDGSKGQDINSHVRLDANISYKITDTVNLNIIGQNLLGEPHREIGVVSDPNAAKIDRSIFGKITWKF